MDLLNRGVYSTSTEPRRTDIIARCERCTRVRVGDLVGSLFFLGFCVVRMCYSLLLTLKRRGYVGLAVVLPSGFFCVLCRLNCG